MIVLHLLYAGGTGGIEKMCKDIGLYSKEAENHFLFAHRGGVICDEMEKAGLHVIRRDYGNKDILSLRRDIKDLCSKLRADVVVIHHPAPLFWLACLALMKKKGKVRFFVYAHNNYAELTGGKAWKRMIYNRLLKKCTGIVAISQFVKESVVAGAKVNPSKVHVVYNGVHIEDYAKVRGMFGGKIQSDFSMQAESETLNLLYVGRLIEKKGVQVLLQALNILKHTPGKKMKEVSLKIVGDGPYRETLEAYVREHELADSVTFLGEQRDICPYMEDAKVFVHPAIWEEGFGITLVEAMSAGLICVAFKRGALPEIIDNGKTGYLVEEVSAKLLANALYQLQNTEQEKLMEMSINARERSKKFSIEELSERLETVYNLGD